MAHVNRKHHADAHVRISVVDTIEPDIDNEDPASVLIISNGHSSASLHLNTASEHVMSMLNERIDRLAYVYEMEMDRVNRGEIKEPGITHPDSLSRKFPNPA